MGSMKRRRANSNRGIVSGFDNHCTTMTLTFSLIVPAAILFCCGLLMVFNTSAAQILDRALEADTHAVFLKQALYGLFGLGAGLGVYRAGYQNCLRYSFAALCAGTVLLVLVFVPGIGQTVNGAKRWIGIGGVACQPSEFIKLLLPLAYIRWVLLQKEFSLSSFMKIGAAFAVPIALILVEPDNGTVIILFALLTVLFFLTRVPFRFWAMPLAFLIAASAVAAFHMPHVRSRIQVYLHPELDLKGKGHQPHQAKIAAGSGGLLGRGIGESLQKLSYLPEARNDYIAAIVAEETGFLGILFLIALYMTLALAGFSIAIRSPDAGGFYLASILTFLISIQAFFNLGVVSALLPSKGTTLPFFSQGGTSLIVNCIILFLLLDIGRKSMRGV